MELYDSPLWGADLDEIVSSLPELETLAGRDVLLTGCTGLIGSAAADVLIRYNETHAQKIRLLAAGRDGGRVRRRFGRYAEAEWFRFVLFDAAAPGEVPDLSGGYIVHCAGNAYPERFAREPAETMLGNFLGVKALLDAEVKSGARRLLYVSSSEVYGKKENALPFREDEYGYVDLLSPRSSYPMGKRASETLCAAYLSEYGADSVIARPGHIYGPTASTADNRVSSVWAFAAARGEDLVLKSDGAQIRSYCYCLDCAAALWKILLRGGSGRAYNISNPDSILTIREMAELLSRSAGVGLQMETPSETEKKGFNPMNNSSLDSASLEALGWRGRFDAERGFAHTVSILRDTLS